MSNNYFLRKRIFNIFKRSVLLLLNAIAATYRFFFGKRTIMFVSNRKIRTIHIGFLSQAFFLSLAIFAGNIFMQSLQFDHILNTKTKEITRLQQVNQYFEEEFSHVNDKIKKVNDYLISVTGEKYKNTSVQKDLKDPKDIKREDLSLSNQKTLDELMEATFAMNQIQEIARKRIIDIENALSDTGLNLKRMPRTTISQTENNVSETEISLNEKGILATRQGGPFLDDETKDLESSDNSDNELDKHLEKAQFSNEFDRLFLLEKLVSVMPLARPMKNYYISSVFGKRSDPINNGRGIHKGLDFAGALNGKIYSTASGKVILAKKYSDYGKAVIIDHGFGVTTRYGHLSSIKVKKGQNVTKGQIIAAQGSTGRSTGQHLHYEVRYRGVPLNPKKFLEAGDFLLKDDATI